MNAMQYIDCVKLQLYLIKYIPVGFKAAKVILCVALYSIKASELERRCTLIYKYKVISVDVIVSNEYIYL